MEQSQAVDSDHPCQLENGHVLAGNHNTGPPYRRADVEKIKVPMTLLEIGIISSRLWMALTIEVIKLTLRTFSKSDAESINKPSRTSKTTSIYRVHCHHG